VNDFTAPGGHTDGEADEGLLDKVKDKIRDIVD
jgi:hypothetical protein